MKIILAFLIVGALLFYLYRTKEEERKLLEELSQLKSNTGELDVSDFLKLRKLANKDFTGIYVIRNLDKDMYYVGQSVKVLNRIIVHFSGNGGNGDVYADYRAGDHFTVSCYSLTQSGYESLDDLERIFIEKFDSYEHGYNKTRGNSNKMNLSRPEVKRTPAVCQAEAH